MLEKIKTTLNEHKAKVVSFGMVTVPMALSAADDTVLTEDTLGDTKATLEAVLNMPIVNGGVYTAGGMGAVYFLLKGTGIIGGKTDIKSIVIGIGLVSFVLSWGAIKTFFLGKFA